LIFVLELHYITCDAILAVFLKEGSKRKHVRVRQSQELLNLILKFFLKKNKNPFTFEDGFFGISTLE
jgi:hypothetical protein